MAIARRVMVAAIFAAVLAASACTDGDPVAPEPQKNEQPKTCPPCVYYGGGIAYCYVCLTIIPKK